MKLIHIGYVVPNIESYRANSFLEGISEPVYDPIQKAKVCLLEVGWGQDIALELIEPVEPDSKVWNFLQKTGGGLHHLCFEVDSLVKAEEMVKAKRMIRILGPVAAAAFGGRRVAFYYGKNKEIVEFLETEG